ncbi:DUF4279 domain-containing protein [Chloroflexia bacterium SDU3-3]|nr:DUF4279 domain-containing protein [Chloroflexia bacterium SDU3-3]
MPHNGPAFRFADSTLQQALARALDEAGLATDGPITPAHERIIERIVNAALPDGWYMATLDRPALAERYRRLKRRLGTPYVECTRDGQTTIYQPIREKIYHHGGMPTHAALIISSAALEPDAITALLGVGPSYTCHQGQPFERPHSLRSTDVPVRPSHTSWWELSSAAHVASNDAQRHIAWLLAALPAERMATLPAGTERIIQLDVVARPARPARHRCPAPRWPRWPRGATVSTSACGPMISCSMANF